MDFDGTLEASRTLPGPLGAAVFVALQMAKANGLDGDELDLLEAQLKGWESGIDEETRSVLAYVLDQRLSEAHGRGTYSGLVTLARRLTIIEAHILHDALVQAGVETRIRREHGSVADVLHPKAGAELWVRPHSLPQAREIIAGLRKASEGVRVCEACGEESPGHFGRCWNCGGVLHLGEKNVAHPQTQRTDAESTPTKM